MNVFEIWLYYLPLPPDQRVLDAGGEGVTGICL